MICTATGFRASEQSDFCVLVNKTDSETHKNAQAAFSGCLESAACVSHSGWIEKLGIIRFAVDDPIDDDGVVNDLVVSSIMRKYSLQPIADEVSRQVRRCLSTASASCS